MSKMNIECTVTKQRDAKISCVHSDSVSIMIPCTTIVDDKEYIIKEIGMFSFQRTSIKNVRFEKDSEVEKISNHAFRGEHIQTLRLPPDCKVLGKDSLIQLREEQPIRLIVNGYCKYFIQLDNSCIYRKNPFELIQIPRNTKYLRIRESTLKIFSNAAYYNNVLTSVVIPSSLIEIGSSCFEGCKRLKRLTFMSDSQLVSIQSCAFCRTALERVDFPLTLTKIGSYAFFNCRFLHNIEFPEGNIIQSIGRVAFGNIGISEYELFHCLRDNGLDDKYEFSAYFSPQVAPTMKYEWKPVILV